LSGARNGSEKVVDDSVRVAVRSRSTLSTISKPTHDHLDDNESSCRSTSTYREVSDELQCKS